MQPPETFSDTSWLNSHPLLQDFFRDQAELQALEQQVLQAVERLIATSGLKVHSLSSRIKAPESLAYKLRRPDRTYAQLRDITDLVGVRIITYFEDTVDALAQLVEQAFEVDYQRSIDKRRSIHASQFGYRSLHYICRPQNQALPAGHATAPPDCSYAFEIQIRTILQHTWAEIEHDLGYKTEAVIPDGIRRRFSRVASLLELADEEFVGIRQQLQHYQSAAQQKLRQSNAAVSLNRLSLQAFLQQPAVAELEKAFADDLGLPLSTEAFYPDYLIRMLKAVEMTELSALGEALQQHRTELLGLSQAYFDFTQRVWQFDKTSVGVFLRGYSLVFLAHLLILRASSLGIERLEKLTRFYQAIDYPHDEAQARTVAEQLIESLQLG